MASRREENKPDVPIFQMMEIFGGAYGILIIILVIMILLQKHVEKEMNDPTKIGGITQTTLGDKVGFVISILPDTLRIERTGEVVTLDELQLLENPFRSFAKNWLRPESSNLALFFVYPESNNVFLSAERILADLEIWYFRQLIINKEMVEELKAINQELYSSK